MEHPKYFNIQGENMHQRKFRVNLDRNIKQEKQRELLIPPKIQRIIPERKGKPSNLPCPTVNNIYIVMIMQTLF